MIYRAANHVLKQILFDAASGANSKDLPKDKWKKLTEAHFAAIAELCKQSKYMMTLRKKIVRTEEQVDEFVEQNPAFKAQWIEMKKVMWTTEKRIDEFVEQNPTFREPWTEIKRQRGGFQLRPQSQL